MCRAMWIGGCLRALLVPVIALLPAAAGAVTQFPPPSIRASLPNVPGDSVAVDRTGMEGFVADSSRDRVAVVDQTMAVTFVPVGRNPRYLASAGFRFYTSNAGDNTVSVRTQVSSAVSIPVGGSGPIVVANGGKAYMARGDGFIVIIDGAALTATAFDTHLGVIAAHAPSPDGTRLYVAGSNGELRVFDISSGTPSQPILGVRLPGNAYAIAAPVTGSKFYVLTDTGGGAIVEVDAAIGAPRTFVMPGPPQSPRTLSVGLDTVFAGFGNELAVFDISTHNATFIPVPEVRSITSDSESNLTFVLDGAANLHVIDPRTMIRQSVQVASGSTQVGFIFKTCEAFVSGPATTVVSAPCGDNRLAGISAQALWWVPEGAESGWGLNIAQQGITPILFATWFTYDAQGQPTWLVMSAGRENNVNGYAGTLYRTSGPPFNAPAFDPARVTRTPAGDMQVFVRNVDSASMTATVDGTTISKQLARQLFAAPVPVCDTDIAAGPLPIYQDLWWNPSESGWGLNIAHQGNVLFITWFTYDTDGSPTWFVGSDLEKTGNATYSGTLYKTFGPPMTASPWNPSQVTRMPVGSATLTFDDDDNGTFAYTVSGISGSKRITRQVFATPVTRCR